jgi:hypothetical protein
MGYGYGARCPTERNVQTLPASIPQYRYPPISERSENLFRSRPMGTGYKADKRLADQIVHQTSGDWGKFLIGVDSSDARLFMKQVPATLAMKKAKSLTASSNNNNNNNNSNNNNNNNNNNNSSTNNSVHSNRNDFNDSRELKSYREGGGSSSSKGESMYQNTLKAIDFKAFPKHAKYNLRAAIQPPPNENQYRGVATNNQLGYKNCLNWSGQLRS